ncbi:MAG: flavodoxin family protein [Clostridia bacterium]|nr:flavodoxin family protein [Clostridia bacterium]
MKVLLVNGSPHKEGCTYTALTEVEKSLNNEGIETEVFWIGNKPIGGCIACLSCKKNKRCAFEDSVNEFVEKMKDADGFIFGSPVHYAGASGNMTSFMDRVFYSAASSGYSDYFKYKPAATVISARRAGTTATYDQLNKYFGICQMPIISSRYWNMVHGSNPDDVRKDEEGMQIMRILGKNMAYYLKCIDAGKEKGLMPPKQEDTVFTNFIR